MARISVCIATYNGSAYVKQQMESILSQLSTDDEVVVSDDSSSDNTVQIVEEFADSRIRVFRGKKFRNVVLNFEHALRQSSGEYIFLADQDDVWVPGKIDQVMANFDTYDMVVSDCKIVDENLAVIRESYFELVNARKGLIRNLIRTSPYIGCCMAFKRKVLTEALPFPRQIPIHDYWIAMICEARFNILLLRSPLVLYRRHGLNLSQTTGKSKNPLSKKLSYRVNTIVPLVKRLFRQ